MAGIAGIFVKTPRLIDGASVVQRMVDELGLAGAESRTFSEESVAFGIKAMDRGQGCKDYADADGKVRCIVDGTVFPGRGLEAERDLPAFYLKYGRDIVNRLTGWYNVFLYDKTEKRCLLFNSRFGMLPLFVYQNDDVFLFCSKLFGIAASKLFPIEWDRVSQLEHAIFNYPLSEHTLLNGVRTASPGSLYEWSIGRNPCRRETYWQFDRLIGIPPLSRSDSIDLIDSTLAQAAGKAAASSKTCALSLTGGWDGRLVLAYRLKHDGNRDLLYSFGAWNSADISIPAAVSEKLGLRYTPVVLDGAYLENHFPASAMDTIRCSSGCRSFLRSHYLFAMRQLAQETDCVFSGNCGSNLLKYSEIAPGAVLTAPLIELIRSSFSPDRIAGVLDRRIAPLSLSRSDIDEFYGRIEAVAKEALRFGENLSCCYFYILLMKVERKFFGFELSSYNDYVNNYSPFIDFDFVDALSQTIYWGAHYPFDSRSGRLKIQSFELYKALMTANRPELCSFQTDRGVSFRQLNRIDGKIIWFLKRGLARLNPGRKDSYNTGDLQRPFLDATGMTGVRLDGLSKNEAANILSTEFFRKELFGRFDS